MTNHLLAPAILLAIALGGCAPSVTVANDPPAPGGPPVEEAVELATLTGAVHGTLLLPPAGGALPVALIIAGSGPTDRDGNSAMLPGQNNSLRYLAEGLAERGIASLRFDKRGIAASAAAAPSEAALRFETYVDDAAAWVRQLRADPRFSHVVLVGHSEGSLIAIRAALDTRVDGLVSIAGIARPAGQVLRDQLRPSLTPELWAESERVLAALEAGNTADSVSPMLAALYRPSVQPYLISWLRHDPAREIARLEVSVLIAQGTNDVQVGVAEARALHAARPDAELVIVEGMNHVLKVMPADPAAQMPSYSDPALPVAPELIAQVAGFIRRIARD